MIARWYDITAPRNRRMLDVRIPAQCLS
jgi:hypothetical protein